MCFIQLWGCFILKCFAIIIYVNMVSVNLILGTYFYNIDDKSVIIHSNIVHI